jgi:DNA-directed RNA polymerase alpha subunit
MSIITPESKIEVLRLSVHACQSLHKAGAIYVSDLLRRAGADLRVHCDDRAMEEIERVLAKAGLRLGEDLEWGQR